MEMMGHYSTGPTASQKEPESPTYEELMAGIAVCHTNRAFEALTDGQELIYIGTDVESTSRGGACISAILEELGIDYPRFYSFKDRDRCLGPETKSEVLLLLLAKRAKAKNANIMHVIERNGLPDAISVELWYTSPKDES
ncbi:MAG: hypothetical protein OSB62_00920 [Alphaproteobacteria bacterium]|nr:hypothetical protein [Alphaproteobacteria bacterium]